MLLLWLRVAVWVVLFSVLWGASLALVVLATTWVALDVLSVPGQDLDSVLARLKQARCAPPPPSLPPASPAPPAPSAPPRLRASTPPHLRTFTPPRPAELPGGRRRRRWITPQSQVSP